MALIIRGISILGKVIMGGAAGGGPAEGPNDFFFTNESYTPNNNFDF